ncbi:MAG: TonB family protein [Chitinophagaceae bacterium]
MANTLDTDFEQKKNMKAGTITLVILALIFLLLFLIGWTTPTIPQPLPEEGMEVNLGNSDAGLGNDQPFEPGKPAPQEQQQYTPPRQAETQKEDVKDPLSNDKDEDAPEVKKPPIVKPEATKVAEKTEVKKTVPKAVEPAPPTPKPPVAKAVFKGVNGTGTGGNEADSYKKGGSEGIAGGKGDQGRPGGDPNSKNYTGGGHGNSGVSIARGLEGRRFTSVYTYQGDFDTNEKVAVDVRIDKNGNVISASYQPRGSTTSSGSYKDKALEVVRKSKFNAAPNGDDEQTGTVIINFKINN